MRGVLFVCLFITSIFGFEKNPYFSSEEELENWFWDSTGMEERRLLFRVEDTTGGKEVWKIETRCFSRLDCSIYVLYDWNFV